MVTIPRHVSLLYKDHIPEPRQPTVNPQRHLDRRTRRGAARCCDRGNHPHPQSRAGNVVGWNLVCPDTRIHIQEQAPDLSESNTCPRAEDAPPSLGRSEARRSC